MYKTNPIVNKTAKEDITLTLNTNIDGAKMFNTTKYSMWDGTCIVNEFLPYLRFKMILVAATWYTVQLNQIGNSCKFL